jgi:hypothetical protein
MAKRVPPPAPAVTSSGVQAALGEHDLVLTLEQDGIAIHGGDAVVHRATTLHEARAWFDQTS